VAFGEHRMMLLPRDSHDQKVIDATLEISPISASPGTPSATMWRFAQFDGRSSELCFESIVILEHSPADAAKLDPLEATWTFPVAYSAEEKPDLADCIQRRYPDPDNEVERWTRQFLHFGRPIGTLELVSRLSEDIHQRFFYRRREAKGIQLTHETLRSGDGSCRDFALLMIEAARSGFASDPLGMDVRVSVTRPP
jgi:hypothetical protein